MARKFLLLLALAGAEAAFAAGKPGKSAKPAGERVKINGVSYPGGANAPAVSPSALSADQALRIKKIFLFPSLDDLSGAMAPKLDDRLAGLFSHNTRFELIRDPQVVKALSPDENSYAKAALSPEVHREAARVTSADTTVLLRTRNVGSDTRMTLELRDARGDLLYAEEGSVPGAAKMEERSALIEKLYRGLLGRLPFEGTVTGRTAATITVDLGSGSMHLNEVIELARIVSLQRHPLLGTVVGTDYVRTGRARVTNVDRVLSFAEVIEEFPGEKISAGQKVLRSQASLVHRGDPSQESAPVEAGMAPHRRARRQDDLEPTKNTGDDPSLDERLKGDFDKPRPRYGQIGANLFYGSNTHAQTQGSSEMDYGGSGIGGELSGEAWITRNWLLSLDYAFQSATLTAPGNISGGSSSWKSFALRGGYRIYPENLAEGLTLTGSVGYQSTKMDIPTNTSLLLGARKYSGPVFQVDGELKFLAKQKLSAGFSIVPFVSYTEIGPSLGVPSGGSMIGVHAAWHYELIDALWFRLSLRYDVATGNYEDSTAGVSDKHFAIGPGVYYLF